MPKPKVRTSAHAPTNPADELIETVRRGTARPLPPPEAIEALRKLIAYNDETRAPTKRVGSQAAIDMLQKHYDWQGASISSLNLLCRQAFGRKSWGVP